MEFEKFEFTFADVLGRRGDFRRDIRSVGSAKGMMLSCNGIGCDDGSSVMARLWMSDLVVKRHSIITVAAFFDPCFVFDTIIVPELKLSFFYRWGYTDFNTEKIMSLMDELAAKHSSTSLCEPDLLRAAAAVCAVYEFSRRLHYEEPDASIPHEVLPDHFGDVFHCPF